MISHQGNIFLDSSLLKNEGNFEETSRDGVRIEVSMANMWGDDRNPFPGN